MKRINSSEVSQLSRELSSIDIQQMLLARAKNSVLEMALDLLEQDMERLCGKPFGRKSEGMCHRGGSETTSLICDGARYSMRRPRARDANGEVELPSLAKLRDRDLLDSQMQSRMVRGVSTRNYEDVISGFAQKTGISKSSVSRAFKRASKKDLEEINSCDLSQFRFVAILIDGTNIGGRMVVVAVGITDGSQKIPLGLKEGDTENAAVVKDLLTGLMARGFTFKTSRLLAARRRKGSESGRSGALGKCRTYPALLASQGSQSRRVFTKDKPRPNVAAHEENDGTQFQVGCRGRI